MPEMIANWFTETMRPRMRAGLISAMYIGLVMDAAPTATPQRMRNDTNSTRLRGIAVPMADTKNNTAASSSTFFRPSQSLSTPAPAAPSTQPSNVQLAAQPVAAALN